MIPCCLRNWSSARWLAICATARALFLDTSVPDSTSKDRARGGPPNSNQSGIGRSAIGRATEGCCTSPEGRPSERPAGRGPVSASAALRLVKNLPMTSLTAASSMLLKAGWSTPASPRRKARICATGALQLLVRQPRMLLQPEPSLPHPGNSDQGRKYWHKRPARHSPRRTHLLRGDSRPPPDMLACHQQSCWWILHGDARYHYSGQVNERIMCDTPLTWHCESRATGEYGRAERAPLVDTSMTKGCTVDATAGKSLPPEGRAIPLTCLDLCWEHGRPTSSPTSTFSEGLNQ